MNIVEYFVRRHLRNRLNSTLERLAAIDELINTWSHQQSSPGKQLYVTVELVANLRAERASLRVRLARLKKELNIEESKEREV